MLLFKAIFFLQATFSQQSFNWLNKALWCLFWSKINPKQVIDTTLIHHLHLVSISSVKLNTAHNTHICTLNPWISTPPQSVHYEMHISENLPLTVFITKCQRWACTLSLTPKISLFIIFCFPSVCSTRGRMKSPEGLDHISSCSLSLSTPLHERLQFCSSMLQFLFTGICLPLQFHGGFCSQF